MQAFFVMFQNCAGKRLYARPKVVQGQGQGQGQGLVLL